MKIFQTEYNEGMEITKILQANLRRMREEAEMSQSDLAKKIGKAVQTIKDIEAGRRNPSMEVLEDLAGALGIDSYKLLAPTKERVISLPMSKIAKRIAAVPDAVYEHAEIVGLDDELWETIAGMLEIRANELKGKANQV